MLQLTRDSRALRRDGEAGRHGSRVPAAVAIGLFGFAAYVVLAVTLADHVMRAPWPVQGLYFLAAGLAWVPPTRWLMLWAAHQR